MRRRPDRITTAIIAALGSSIAMVTPTEAVAGKEEPEYGMKPANMLNFYVNEGWMHLLGITYNTNAEVHISEDLDAETIANAPQSVKKAYQCFYVADLMMRDYPSLRRVDEQLMYDAIREARGEVDFYIPEIEKHFENKTILAWRTEVENNPEICKYKSSNPCFISTAVFRARGEDDDCRELTLLRHFRDDWLKRTPAGEALVQRYYDIAPAIVGWIERLPGSSDILHAIFEQRLEPMIRAIEAGDNPLAFSYYINMVEVLEHAYHESL